MIQDYTSMERTILFSSPHLINNMSNHHTLPTTPHRRPQNPSIHHRRNRIPRPPPGTPLRQPRNQSPQTPNQLLPTSTRLGSQRRGIRSQSLDNGVKERFYIGSLVDC